METAGDSDRAFILKTKLTTYLNDSRGLYDYILIDCPPSLSLLTVMALVSSNSLIVPLQTEFFALEGLTQLIKTIERIKTNLNPELKIQGILLTMYDQEETNFHRRLNKRREIILKTKFIKQLFLVM